MTKEERKKYDAEYNKRGYKKKANRKYYMKHRDDILRKRKQKASVEVLD